MSPADLADDADKPQNYNNPKTKLATNCLYLRDNAACCIPLRDLRNLRENHTQKYSINPHTETPIFPADSPYSRRQKTVWANESYQELI